MIAGLAKGRRLAVPASGTRPTSDRVREALFNTLAGYVRLDGARVLDLYAGTGAVGLEALSRGATTAVLVESNRRALEVLRRNVDTVGLPGAQLVPRTVSRYLADPPDEPFDIVFADPPYDLPDAKVYALTITLGSGRWLAADSVLVIERGGGVDPFCVLSGGVLSGGVVNGGVVSGGVVSGGVVAGGLLTPVAEKRYGDSVLWYGRPR